MEQNQIRKITFIDSVDLLKNISQQAEYQINWSESRKIITCLDAHQGKVFDLKLPLAFPKSDGIDSLSTYLEQLPEVPKDYLILLIQAGNAALAYIADGKIESHKVIRKYMIRAKQGKAQLGHLKTKGKSKAGSRVRLAQTILFFEEINEKLQEWEVENTNQIFFSASIQIWNLLFESKIKPPFEKKDARLIKIPKDLPIPNFELLVKVNQFLQTAYLRAYQDLEDKFM